jgi:RHS repeat-associated protein
VVGGQPQPLTGKAPYNPWVLSSETLYLYDGFRVIQERNSNNVPVVSYTRGNDLSQTLEGAGGIGGLLARSDGYSNSTGNWTDHNYYHADGNGNITYLVNSSQGLAAAYRYDPFGNLTYSSGSLAGSNVYRFSSKEQHLNSGLYYCLYRFYDPVVQRWLNRDPESEAGGVNLHGFASNDPVDRRDPLGLACPAGYTSVGTAWLVTGSRPLVRQVSGYDWKREARDIPPDCIVPPDLCARGPGSWWPPIHQSRECRRPFVAEQLYETITEGLFEQCQNGFGFSFTEVILVRLPQSRSYTVPAGEPFQKRSTGPWKCGEWEDINQPVTGPIVG